MLENKFTNCCHSCNIVKNSANLGQTSSPFAIFSTKHDMEAGSDKVTRKQQGGLFFDEHDVRKAEISCFLTSLFSGRLLAYAISQGKDEK